MSGLLPSDYTTISENSLQPDTGEHGSRIVYDSVILDNVNSLLRFGSFSRAGAFAACPSCAPFLRQFPDSELVAKLRLRVDWHSAAWLHPDER